MKYDNGNTLVEQNKIDWPEMDDRESTSMDYIGESPWGGNNNPMDVWCWDEDEDQVLIGTCPDECRIVSYAEAREIYNN